MPPRPRVVLQYMCTFFALAFLTYCIHMLAWSIALQHETVPPLFTGVIISLWLLEDGQIHIFYTLNVSIISETVNSTSVL